MKYYILLGILYLAVLFLAVKFGRFTKDIDERLEQMQKEGH